MNEDRSSSAAQVSEPRRSGMGDDLKANVCDSKATGVLYREKKKQLQRERWRVTIKC